jgi:protein SCO1/2
MIKTGSWRVVGLFALWGIGFGACSSNQDERLPYLGQREIVDGDTVYHKIPDFQFVNQDSQWVDNQTFDDKAYVADFFFISCPTICPKVKKQMLRVYERFRDEDRLLLLSHSIDTRNDTVGRLRVYAENLGVSSDKWHFVTGDKDALFNMAEYYFSIAVEDPNAPGGFDHSGRLILVDPKRHVRSFCNGTDPESVDRFMLDIEKLLREMDQLAAAADLR